jgi:hypothetical protein
MRTKEISEMTLEELTEYRAEADRIMHAFLEKKEELLASMFRNKIRVIDVRLEYLKHKDIPVTF